ncbi:ribonuclease Z [uncultured Lutibacter sp.]|uniref:ribonuclease Z n=1 Tax=uncultured Lutibacter sp. TaxID=437739 RepID=UPI0026239D46|nr:ribonuclease Z [uncultured Lutibacter sp.]
MFSTKTKNYTHIKPNTKSVSDFLLDFKNRYQEFKNENLIIDFSEKFNINIKELILFLKLSKQHIKNGTSFVLICKGINIDNIPDELNVVPTLTEAIDILEMDAIERDLGF